MALVTASGADNYWVRPVSPFSIGVSLAPQIAVAAHALYVAGGHPLGRPYWLEIVALPQDAGISGRST